MYCKLEEDSEIVAMFVYFPLHPRVKQVKCRRCRGSNFTLLSTSS